MENLAVKNNELKENEMMEELTEQELKEIDEMCEEMEKLEQGENKETMREFIERIEQEDKESEQEMVVCEDCGEEIPRSDAVELDGKYYCECCAENYEKCDCCGEYHLKEDMRTVANGDRVCDNCIDDYYSYCHECNQWVDNDYMCEVFGKDSEKVWMCEDCRDEKCFYCNGYGEYFMDYYHDSYTVDGRTYSDAYCENNFYWCDECETYHRCEEDCPYYEEQSGDYEYNYNNFVRDYHCAPSLRFFGLGDRRRHYSPYTKACIGIELEVDREEYDSSAQSKVLNKICDLTDNANLEVYFEHDGSLNNGFEIITQPHTIESFYKMKWQEIMNVLIENGYTSHDLGTCGLHMHISRDFFGTTKQAQERAIAKLMIFFDANYGEIIKVSRRNYAEAQRWANRTYNSDVSYEQYKEAAKQHFNDRYRAVNNRNNATVEFRIMRGTLKYSSFIACIDFLYRVAMNSKTIKYKEILNNKLWLKGINENTKAYLKERNAFLNVIGEQE